MNAPIWISHRGLKVQAPENTLEAFRDARGKGFHRFETDLRSTSDGHIVLSHDSTLQRIAGKPLQVEKSTRKELEKVILPFNTRLLFLEDLLVEFRDIKWLFDIKADSAVRTINKFKRMIKDRELVDWVEAQVRFLVWNSAHQKLLRETFRMAPFYARGAECKIAGIAALMGVPALSGIEAHKIYSLTPTYMGMSLYTERIVSIYRKRKARILAFLPKKREDIERAIDLGFDEILVDDKPLHGRNLV